MFSFSVGLHFGISVGTSILQSIAFHLPAGEKKNGGKWWITRLCRNCIKCIFRLSAESKRRLFFAGLYVTRRRTLIKQLWNAFHRFWNIKRGKAKAMQAYSIDIKRMLPYHAVNQIKPTHQKQHRCVYRRHKIGRPSLFCLSRLHLVNIAWQWEWWLRNVSCYMELWKRCVSKIGLNVR